MKFKFAKYLLLSLTLIFLLLPDIFRAQTNSGATVPASSSASALMSDVPFRAGEVLVYEAKFNRTLVPPLTIGDLTFSVVESPDGSGNRYLIRSEAQSRGVAKLFGKNIVQKLESDIDGEKFRSLRSVKYDEQGERVRNSESVFDYEQGKVTYTETNPNDPARRPYQLASSIPEVACDVVVGVYSLRMLPLAVGKTFYVTISDSGLVYEIPVKVTARERQKSILGKVWTYRVEPDVFGDKRPLAGKGKMVIWIMDDARRIPVRSEITASIGRIDVKLKKVTTPAD
jgi:hypothetical protein